MTTIWSYGGGTQSVAIAVLILQGRLPKPDAVLIADTGRELSTTWDYMAEVTGPALERIGLPIQIVGTEYSRYDLMKSGRNLLPAFTTQGDGIGKLPTYCSNEWKQRPVRRWLRTHGHHDCDVWLGISTDEIERMKPSGLQWYRHVYPLIELVPTSRAGCVALVEGYGWPTPPKSRCWMCPNQSPGAWQQMKRNQPDEFRQAIGLEKDIQRTDPHLWLHSAAIPLADAVELSEAQHSLFDGCDSGYCMT
jgi:hypothetical protein